MAYSITIIWLCVGADWCQDFHDFKGEVMVRTESQVGNYWDAGASGQCWNRRDTSWYSKGWDKSKPYRKTVFHPMSLLWVGELHQDVMCGQEVVGYMAT